MSCDSSTHVGYRHEQVSSDAEHNDQEWDTHHVYRITSRPSSSLFITSVGTAVLSQQVGSVHLGSTRHVLHTARGDHNRSSQTDTGKEIKMKITKIQGK